MWGSSIPLNVFIQTHPTVFDQRGLLPSIWTIGKYHVQQVHSKRYRLQVETDDVELYDSIRIMTTVIMHSYVETK